MDVETFDDANRFLTGAETYLVRDEAVNNLILGVSAVARTGGYDTFAGWVVRDQGEVVATAVRTAPHNLIVSRAGSEAAIHTLAGVTRDIPVAIGCRPEIDWFVGGRTNARRTLRQGIYQLSEVRGPIHDQPRPAEEADWTTLADWVVAFAVETGQSDLRDRAVDTLARRFRGPEAVGGVWVLDVREEVVCMSGYGGPTPNGIRIGPVYTPPQHRGRGYASSLVAAQSQWLLDQGRRFCFLYTDLDNPTSNSIYQQIGYEMIAESADYRFNR